MKRFVAVLLVMILLASCGAPADTTADAKTTDEPVVTDATETEAPEDNIPDEPAPFAGVTLVSGNTYKASFENRNGFEFDASNAAAVFESARSNGYAGSLLGMLASSAYQIDMLADGGVGAESLGRAMKRMLENFDDYFVIKGVAKDLSVEVVKHNGFVSRTSDGKCYPSNTQGHSQYLEVESGDTLTLLKNGETVSMRRVTAFKNGAVAPDCSSQVTKTYRVSGATHVIVDFDITEEKLVLNIKNSGSAVDVRLKSRVNADTLAELALGDDVYPVNFRETKASLENEVLRACNNHVMGRKLLTLTFNTEGLGEGELIALGHGGDAYGGSAIEITKDRIRSYNSANQRRTWLLDEPHGLDISGDVKVVIRTDLRYAVITVECGEQKYVSTEVHWFGRKDYVFAESKGVLLKDVKLEWGCFDYSRDAWYFGDSFFDVTSVHRWPYYMVEDGYTDFFMSGYPGRVTSDALADFKRALEFGTPKYIVWCMGMNDGDREGAINADYKKATDEMLAICKEKGITPILCTIPNTPTVINIHKNEWVKSSGYRYVDFAAGVGAEEKGSPWIEGMLSDDKVHPVDKGARALYEQLKKDIFDVLK